MTRLLPLAALALLTAACGGGGNTRPDVAMPHHPAPLPAAEPHHARHAPIYQTDTHLYAGADQRLRPSELPRVGERAGVVIHRGARRDGAGMAAVRAYRHETFTLPWRTAPPVTYDGPAADADNVERLVRAVQLVNAALPEPRKMTVAAQAQPDPGGGIHVRFSVDIEPGRWGTTYGSWAGNAMVSADITIFGNYTREGDRRATILVAHELMHALSLHAHVPESTESILRGSASDYIQTAAQPLSLLYPVDREALRSVYDPDSVSWDRFGPWSDTTTHLAGNAPHSDFGVAWRNGYAEPWALGEAPSRTLAASGLTGTITWTGALVGFTPTALEITGGAGIEVNLSTLAGRATFDALETEAGSQWGDGDLAYAIAVDGNTFHDTAGDAGRLTGIFVGHRHEGAAGTLERTDLTAAFGAERE